MDKTIDEQIVFFKKKIHLFTADYTLELLVNKFINKTLTIPDYQRSFVWDNKRKSRFIESLLIGIPIPVMFLWESSETGKLEIVDGSQRIRTLHEFMDNRLKLNHLDKLDTLNGKNWESLTAPRKEKFQNRTIRVNILDERTEASTRFDMFDRINTSPKKATPVEIRRGALPGPFMDLILKLSENNKFRRLAPLTTKRINDKDYEDLITRLFAYYDDLENYKNSPSDFLYEYVKKQNIKFNDKKEKLSNYEKKFDMLLNFIDKNFPNHFRKKGNKYTTHAYFEAIAVGSLFAIKEKPEIISQDINVSKWINNDEFNSIVTSDAANSKLKARINYVRNCLLK